MGFTFWFWIFATLTAQKVSQRGPRGRAGSPRRNTLLTWGEVVLDLEADALQLVVTEEADPHEAAAGQDQAGAERAAEAVDERREAEGAVPHLDVVEATLEGGLDEELLVKHQLDPLTRQR